MNRRRALALVAAAALAPATAARAGPQRYPLADAFLLLQPYLALPPAQRTRFHPAYLPMHGPKRAADVQATMISAAGLRTLVVLDANGEVANLPSLEDLKSKAQFEIDGPSFDFILEFRATLAPAARIDVAAIVQALAQLNAAVVKFTEGASGVAQLGSAYFPDGGPGQAVFADGHATPLPMFTFKTLGPTAYLEPARTRGALAVQLTTTPTRIILAGHPGG